MRVKVLRPFLVGINIAAPGSTITLQDLHAKELLQRGIVGPADAEEDAAADEQAPAAADAEADAEEETGDQPDALTSETITKPNKAGKKKS